MTDPITAVTKITQNCPKLYDEELFLECTDVLLSCIIYNFFWQKGFMGSAILIGSSFNDVLVTLFINIEVFQRGNGHPLWWFVLKDMIQI